jgi:pimeloyl-ACP methyl ester carboxylesterase
MVAEVQTMEIMAEEVKKYWIKLDLTKVHLLGHSMGYVLWPLPKNTLNSL